MSKFTRNVTSTDIHLHNLKLPLDHIVVRKLLQFLFESRDFSVLGSSSYQHIYVIIGNSDKPEAPVPSSSPQLIPGVPFLFLSSQTSELLKHVIDVRILESARQFAVREERFYSELSFSTSLAKKSSSYLFWRSAPLRTVSISARRSSYEKFSTWPITG